MALKLLCAVVFAALISQGFAVTTIYLNDVTHSHVSSDWHPYSMGIAKHTLFDTLLGCNIVYPNGQVYEAFPNDKVPSPVEFAGGWHPFQACSVFFRNPPGSMSGTYELLSHTLSSEDNNQYITRQKFHVTFTQSDVWSHGLLKNLKAASKK